MSKPTDLIDFIFSVRLQKICRAGSIGLSQIGSSQEDFEVDGGGVVHATDSSVGLLPAILCPRSPGKFKPPWIACNRLVARHGLRIDQSFGRTKSLRGFASKICVYISWIVNEDDWNNEGISPRPRCSDLVHSQDPPKFYFDKGQDVTCVVAVRSVHDFECFSSWRRYERAYRHGRCVETYFGKHARYLLWVVIQLFSWCRGGMQTQRISSSVWGCWNP